MKYSKSFIATIHCGLKETFGESIIHPIDKAKSICQSFVDDLPDCVSVTPTEYVYTGGCEHGVIVQFIQYPRFPRPESEIRRKAIALASELMNGLNQFKVSVIFPDETVMLENEKLNR